MGKLKGWEKKELDTSNDCDEIDRLDTWRTEGLYHPESVEIIRYKTPKKRVQSLESILERLSEISKKELKNKTLTQEDCNIITKFREQLEGVIAEIVVKDNPICVFYGDAGEGKFFDNLTDARKFAVDWMRKHPEGSDP